MTAKANDIVAWMIEIDDDVHSMWQYDGHAAMAAAVAANDQAAIDAVMDDARAMGALRSSWSDQVHAATHGRSTLRYGTVERRAGYRGQTVCLDCYHGR